LRRLPLLFCTIWLCACNRLPESYAPPEQRQPVLGRTYERASMMVNMNDEDAPEHFVKDIGHKLEGNSWRWCEKRPTVRILLVKTQGLKFKTDFTIWEGCLKQTGPVTVSFWIGDKLLDKIRYDTPGYKHLEKPVDPSWLQTQDDTLVAEEIDKLYLDPVDGTKLGFILTSIGFERQ